MLHFWHVQLECVLQNKVGKGFLHLRIIENHIKSIITTDKGCHFKTGWLPEEKNPWSLGGLLVNVAWNIPVFQQIIEWQ